MKPLPSSRRRSHAGFAGVFMLVSTMALAAERFDLQVFGHFKRMMHTGDASGKVKLADLPAGSGLWGVGALADLAGEVLVYDGAVHVSRGEDVSGRSSAPLPGEQATLLVTAKADRWTGIPVPADLDGNGFETFVLAQARALGLADGEAFPFRVSGRFPQLTWHVLTGQRNRNGAPAGHGHAPANSRVFRQPGADGHLVGIYSGGRWEGVITHPGERFHLHYLDAARAASGHVDGYVVGKGAVLYLPG